VATVCIIGAGSSGIAARQREVRREERAMRRPRQAA
jgi:cation diffusion facilitator CzcD-associated flavoprotein CzcO